MESDCIGMCGWSVRRVYPWQPQPSQSQAAALNTPLPTVQGSSGDLEAGFECLEEFYPYKQLLRRSTGSADQCKGMPCHGKAGLGVLLCSVMGSNGGHEDGTAYCSYIA
jgi:hypothetical protein